MRQRKISKIRQDRVRKIVFLPFISFFWKLCHTATSSRPSLMRSTRSIKLVAGFLDVDLPSFSSLLPLTAPALPPISSSNISSSLIYGEVEEEVEDVIAFFLEDSSFLRRSLC